MTDMEQQLAMTSVYVKQPRRGRERGERDMYQRFAKVQENKQTNKQNKTKGPRLDHSMVRWVSQFASAVRPRALYEKPI
jgi:hypothetical protein